MEARQAILSKVEGYLSATGMSAHQFGMATVKSHKLLARLRAGKGITLTTIEKIEAFIRSNPPAKRKAA